MSLPAPSAALRLKISPMQDLKLHYVALVSDMKVTIVCKNKEAFASNWTDWVRTYARMMVDTIGCEDKENVSSLIVWLFGVYYRSPRCDQRTADDFYFGPSAYRCEVTFAPKQIFRCGFPLSKECTFRSMQPCGIRNDQEILQSVIEVSGVTKIGAIDSVKARSLFSQDPFIMLGEAYQTYKRLDQSKEAGPSTPPAGKQLK
ncbi:TPA_asm: M [Populus betacytorhabdovirus 1]|nr:TPA_asm: M [Populus betacytorhabdovirus 1]